VLYVTHAFDEVARLADSLVLLDSGKVVASGTLSEVVVRADLPLARRDDASALLLSRVAEHDMGRDLTRLEAGGTNFWVPRLDIALDARCRIRIPAREVILASQAPEAISVHNIVAGTVRKIADATTRHSVLVEIALPDGALLSRVTTDAITRLKLSPGAPVLVLVKSTSIEVLHT
jgi:molybdate transport system ATP-binding protein